MPKYQPKALPCRDLSEVAGVIPRAISQIFSKLDTDDSEYTVKCSFLELYNEETTDLLAVGDAVKAAAQKLRILEDRGGVVVQGLEEIIVKSSADIYALLDRGSAKRRCSQHTAYYQDSLHYALHKGWLQHATHRQAVHTDVHCRK